MEIDVLLYDGFDDLDAIAPWEVLESVSRARDDLDVALVTLEGAREVVSGHGTVVRAQRELGERPDVLVVPGGGWQSHAPVGVRAEVERGELPEAIARCHAAGTLVASVCTGAMLLAAGGLLRDRPAITARGAVEDLAAAGARIVRARVVDDGDVVTSAGVTSGLDLAVWLVERHFGADMALAAEAGLEYERRGTVWRRGAEAVSG